MPTSRVTARPLDRTVLRRVVVAAVGAALVALGVLAVQLPADRASAATVTVADAIASQSGTATVRGYVVGQPTGTGTVVRSGFPSDYALALADTPGETDTDAMLYVRLTTDYRADWGLAGHPDLLGDRIDVTGPLGAYFSHPGLTGPTAIVAAGSGDPTDPPPTDPTDPPPSDDPGDYYDGTEGLTGDELEAELHRIVSTGVTRLSYDEVWGALQDTDEDPDDPGNVILLYTGDSRSEDAYGGDADDWNREHVWAKSHGDFGTATGPGTDLHHLRPTDVTVNADRGNLDFDDVGPGGTENDEAPGNYADADSWEPRDEVKGDVARMIFYMSVRYDGGDGFADLEVNDQVGNGSAPYLGRLSTLLAWNDADPVSAFEQHRNDVIYEDYQGNRNPFVDHPAWADAIWD